MEGAFVANFDSATGNPLLDKLLDPTNTNVADTLAVDDQENIYIAVFVYGSPTSPPPPPPPPSAPGSGSLPSALMQISVKKLDNNDRS